MSVPSHEIKVGRNVGASVRARLLNVAQKRGQVFDLVLIRYALERLLYRLSVSNHRKSFVLKGAMLVTIWFEDPHRPTRDLDLLGYGEFTPESLLVIFREICEIACDDGISFDSRHLRIDVIREELRYGGVRIRTTATIAKARVAVVVDVGFGDATEPGLQEIDLPVLLDMPAPRLRAYAPETVIAEKFQAMVTLGRANSRMKDFYDIWVLSRTFDFDTDRLAKAIAATFRRRDTAIPEALTDALTPEFSGDEIKAAQWAAFTRDLDAKVPPLTRIVSDIASFLRAHLETAARLTPVTSAPP